MSRWEPNAAGRLWAAAIALFEERGYNATTVADIARTAGLTKRTFFRYFADKREVLFAGSEVLEAQLVASVSAAPATARPAEAAAGALDAVASLFDEGRDFSVRRQRVIESSPELQERELIKRDRLADAIAGALRERGTEEPAASLAAHTAMAAFHVAFTRWVSSEHRETFREQLHEARQTLSEFDWVPTAATGAPVAHARSSTR
jgi:AcrR family transcriptional regulator